MPSERLMPGAAKVETSPAAVTRLTVSLPRLVNHRLPSGPVVIRQGWLMPASVKVTTAPPV